MSPLQARSRSASRAHVCASKTWSFFEAYTELAPRKRTPNELEEFSGHLMFAKPCESGPEALATPAAEADPVKRSRA